MICFSLLLGPSLLFILFDFLSNIKRAAGLHVAVLQSKLIKSLGELREWRTTNMKIAALLKIVFYLFLLLHCRTFAARPHSSGSDEMETQYRQMGGRGGNHPPRLAPRWWSEDYSLPSRRRHVHNNLKP